MKIWIYYICLLLIVSFSEISIAQDIENQLKNADIIESFNKDRTALYNIHREKYLPIDEEIDILIKRIAKEDVDKEIKEKVYERLHDHFTALSKIPSRHLRKDIEGEILNWVFPVMLEMAKKENDLHKRLIGMLPDAYPALKIIVDQELMKEVNKEMAMEYSKSLFHIIRMHPDLTLDFDYELALAAKHAPFEAKQYLHYSNNVHKILETIEDDTVQVIFDIYEKYKFSGSSYYFLEDISTKNMSIAAAETQMQKEEQLLNTMIQLYKRPGYIAKQSIRDKIDELNSKLLMRLRWQRYSSKSELKLEDIENLSKENAFFLMVQSSNLLEKIDLQNFCYLIEKMDEEKIASSELQLVDKRSMIETRERFKQDDISPLLKNLLTEEANELLADLEISEELAVSLATISDPISHVTSTKSVLERPRYHVKPYTFSISKEEKDKASFKFNQLKTLNDLETLKQSIYAEEILTYLSAIDPIAVAAKLNEFNYEPYAFNIVYHIAEIAPQSVKGFLQKEDHKFNYFFEQSEDTILSTLKIITKKLNQSTRSYLLLDQIVNGETNLFLADHTTKDNQLLIPQLIRSLSKEKVLGKYSLEQELSYHALDFVRNFNISENTDGSFEEHLHDLDAQTLYSFLVYSESEIIRVTFLKMYDEFIKQLRGESLYTFLEDVGFNKVRTFLRMAIYYGKEFDLYSRMNTSEKDQLFTLISKNLDKGDIIDLEEVINMAEIIINIKDYKSIQTIQSQFKRSYEECERKKIDKGVAVYGILSSLLAGRITTDEWVKYVAPHYRLPYINNIPGFELFDKNSANIQQYFFYNDRDGRDSYKNFIRQYEKTPSDWRIEDKGSFVRIQSRNGKRVEILANKPELGDLGVLKMESFLNKNNMHPQIVVHRGLSTHTLKTFNRIPSSAKIILDGSCGGFHVQQVALERAPEAHILCNRNIGTMQINDPMFKQISDDIRMGRDINWPDFWSKMTARLGSNPYFKDYIPPHKNVAALILKAYYDKLGLYK